MKTILLTAFFAFTINLLPAQMRPAEYDRNCIMADSLFKLRDYNAAAEKYSLAFKSFGWKGSEADRYSAAKAWAMAKVPDSAFYNLERIIVRLGFSDYEKITSEKDFTSLHSDKRWQSLIDQVKRNKLPSGWSRWGDQIASYQMYLDSAAGQEGRSALCVQSVDEEIDGFGTIMQEFLAEKYLGKRIKMTGYLRTSNVKGWTGLWMRVDEQKSRKPLAFDNMQDRSVKGTSDWKKYEVVLDVSKDAYKIAFGALLHGTGQIWFEKFAFEEVSTSVPATGTLKSRA